MVKIEEKKKKLGTIISVYFCFDIFVMTFFFVEGILLVTLSNLISRILIFFHNNIAFVKLAILNFCSKYFYISFV